VWNTGLHVLGFAGGDHHFAHRVAVGQADQFALQAGRRDRLPHSSAVQVPAGAITVSMPWAIGSASMPGWRGSCSDSARSASPRRSALTISLVWWVASSQRVWAKSRRQAVSAAAAR
jgi:hypothetical protein